MLALDGNRISQLPASIGQLARLESLALSDNCLDELPPSIGKLARLRQLLVSRNRLTRLPDELGECGQLEELDAHHNALVVGAGVKGWKGVGSSDCLPGWTQRDVAASMDHQALLLIPVLLSLPAPPQELPASLGRLQRLKLLQCDGNCIGAVPPALLRAPALATLSLHANPITPAVLAATDGYAEFEARRRDKASKALATGVLLGRAGLDEGVDRRVEARGPPTP